MLVYEHAGDGVAYGVLTGDALLIGDAGRPDLLSGYAAWLAVHEPSDT